MAGSLPGGASAGAGEGGSRAGSPAPAGPSLSGLNGTFVPRASGVLPALTVQWLHFLSPCCGRAGGSWWVTVMLPPWRALPVPCSSSKWPFEANSSTLPQDVSAQRGWVTSPRSHSLQWPTSQTVPDPRAEADTER